MTYIRNALRITWCREWLLGRIITGSDTHLGLNVGAGAELDIGFGRTYGGAKYIIGRDDVFQVILGVVSM